MISRLSLVHCGFSVVYTVVVVVADNDPSALRDQRGVSNTPSLPNTSLTSDHVDVLLGALARLHVQGDQAS